jgi:hypothetical protein
MELPNGTKIILSGNEVKVMSPDGVIIWVDTNKQGEIQVATDIDSAFVNYGDKCVVATNRIVKE